MLSQVAVDVSSRFRFICNRNRLSVHAPHLSAFQALDLPHNYTKTEVRKWESGISLPCLWTMPNNSSECRPPPQPFSGALGETRDKSGGPILPAGDSAHSSPVGPPIQHTLTSKQSDGRHGGTLISVQSSISIALSWMILLLALA